MAGLAASTQAEAAFAKIAAKQSRQLSPIESAEIDQQVTFQLIESKRSEYLHLAASVQNKYGQNPIYLTKELTYKLYKENRFVEMFEILPTAASEVYQLITLANSVRSFYTDLNDLANQRSALESLVPYSDKQWLDILNNRISTAVRERNLALQQLPSFLQQKLAPAINTANNFNITQSISEQISSIDRLFQETLGSAGPYKWANKKITAPLSKPELDALHSLVIGQSNKSIGPRWADYHVSLLHSESARYLNEASQALRLIQPRIEQASTLLVQKRAEAEARRVTEAAARQAAQQQAEATARQIAQQQAEAAARQLAEQQAEAVAQRQAEAAAAAQQAEAEATTKAEQARERSRSRAHATLASMIAAPTLTPAVAPTALTFQAAMTRALSTFIASARLASIPFSAIVYSPELGNGELRPRDNHTPVSPPGIDALGSTILPEASPLPPIYPGGQAVANPSQTETLPGVDPADTSANIPGYPADEDLPSPDVMVARNTPGIASGTGQSVAGTFLGEVARTSGVPIPSHLADNLRGRNFATFDRFRKAFWTEVSRDGDLLRQFSPSNQALLLAGNAPIARFVDWAVGRKTFELHHEQEIKDGGPVYDMDNLKILTPKAHSKITKANRP